ncbi:monocarboxylate transporter 12-B [Antennarius striatus]|uniref:monocarboxylate transporter 12-B n=1 Tax=Antennarius striatus TaxID=241820 RepID=UPI0035B10562
MAQGGTGRPTPLDGGWGWVVVCSCFIVTVCTRAVTRCVSIFFVEFQAQFQSDYASTAWVHSLVDSATMLCAPLGSLIANRWSCRVSVMVGGVLASCGLLLSSFSTSLELLYFSMGIMTGVGFALCYTPAIVMVGVAVGRRRALAYGVAMSGSGIGTFVLAPVVQLLIERYSWRGALLILSALVANLCVCGALLQPVSPAPGGADGEDAPSGGRGRQAASSPVHLPDACRLPHDPKQAEKLIQDPEDSAQSAGLRRRLRGRGFRSSSEYAFLLLPDFLGLAVSFLFLASGCSLPFIYLVPYALRGGVAPQRAAFLMSVLGAVDIVGNVTYGWLTDLRCLRPHRLLCYLVAVAMEGVCCLLVPLLRSFPLLVPFAAVYGYFDGAYVALIPVVTSDLVGTQYLSSALGVVYFLHAIPYLISPPTGGWLVDLTGSYTATFLFSGAMLLTSSFILSLVVGVRRYRRDRRQAALP